MQLLLQLVPEPHTQLLVTLHLLFNLVELGMVRLQLKEVMMAQHGINVYFKSYQVELTLIFYLVMEYM